MPCPFSFLASSAGLSAAITAGAIAHFKIDVSDQLFALSVLGLTLPHMLYYFVWNNSRMWHGLFKTYSVFVFSSFATILKGLQLFVWYQWFHKLPEDHLIYVAAFLTFVAIALNTVVTYKLGFRGVYYGFRLGHDVPSVTSFPFSWMRHPQYVASVIGWTSVAIICSAVYWREVLALLLVQVTAFLFTASIESANDIISTTANEEIADSDSGISVESTRETTTTGKKDAMELAMKMQGEPSSPARSSKKEPSEQGTPISKKKPSPKKRAVNKRSMTPGAKIKN